jgi:hypothetical protein
MRAWVGLVSCVVVACGSRTGLDVDFHDDASAPAKDAAPHVDAGVVETGVDAKPIQDAAIEADTGVVEAGPDASLTPLCDPPTKLASPSDRFLAIDATYVYYTEGTSAELRRVPKAGGKVDTICSIKPFQGPEGGAIAVDDTYVYFVDSDGIERVSKGGGTVTLLYATPTLNAIGPLAINGTYLVWDESHYQTSSTYVGRMPLPGSTATIFVTDGDGSNDNVAIDANDAYFLQPGTITYVPIGGGTETTLATTTTKAWVWSLLVDGTDIFWEESLPASKKIYGTSKGNTPTLLWSSKSIEPIAMTVDAANFYVGDFSFPIYRIPRGGGSETLFANNSGSVEAIAQDATSVYWTSYGVAVMKCDK